MRAPFPPGGLAHGSLPQPEPDEKIRPQGYWEEQTTIVRWAAGSGNEVEVGSWGTPMFDLRPDLVGVTSRRSQAVAIERTTGSQLFILIGGLFHDHSGINVFQRTFGHPSDPELALQITPLEDITGEIVVGDLKVALLAVFPPESGYPMRYWKFGLRFVINQEPPATLPEITVSAAIY